VPALAAQAPAPPAAPTPAVRVLPPAVQIAAATAAAPAELRGSATVLGYSPDGRLTTLRAGTGDLVCLASDPKRDDFHVACYAKSLEPFMARGRELRAQGMSRAVSDSVRNAEVTSGKLAMPKHAAALYTLTGPASSVNPTTGGVTGTRPLYVVYIPFATPESTGLSPTPVRGAPWIMFPGTPKAHIMFAPDMR
jgi:hypothetical protein